MGCNPEIITEEQFKMVQEERLRRSNIIKNEDGTILRKSTHYSMNLFSDKLDNNSLL